MCNMYDENIMRCLSFDVDMLLDLFHSVVFPVYAFSNFIFFLFRPFSLSRSQFKLVL